VDTQTVKSVPDAPPPGSAAAAVDEAFRRAKEGDLQAFRELLRLHKMRVFSMALRIIGNTADAEEIAQDVFLQLHGSLAQISSSGHLKHWLLRAVSHRCIDRLRSRSSRPRLVSIDGFPESVQVDAAGESDPLAIAQVRTLMLELAPEARTVLLMRYQEDLAPSEIATVLAMPVNTVKSHLRRSLEWLRAQLEGDTHGD
jgi:RNA polymerase sigma-70 factor (ECF subfamily)